MPSWQSGAPPRYCWDSCVLLSYINQVPQRIPVLDGMLAAARGGAIRLFVSTLSIVEVAFAQSEKMNRELKVEELQKIDGLWLDGIITPVEVDTLIAQRARQLVRAGLRFDWKLKAPDAVHLATAEHLDAYEFHTYDAPLKKYEEFVGCPITEPNYEFQQGLGLPDESPHQS